jgi:hypothetical protein
MIIFVHIQVPRIDLRLVKPQRLPKAFRIQPGDSPARQFGRFESVATTVPNVFSSKRFLVDCSPSKFNSRSSLLVAILAILSWRDLSFPDRRGVLEGLHLSLPRDSALDKANSRALHMFIFTNFNCI